MKLITITAGFALASALAFGAAGQAFAQKARADSPTATLDTMIAEKAAELKELRQRRAAVREAARAENRTTAIQRAEARLQALREQEAKGGGKGGKGPKKG